MAIIRIYSGTDGKSHFQEIVQSSLLRCAAIAHVESSIVLEHLKDTTALPLQET